MCLDSIKDKSIQGKATITTSTSGEGGLEIRVDGKRVCLRLKRHAAQSGGAEPLSIAASFWLRLCAALFFDISARSTVFSFSFYPLLTRFAFSRWLFHSFRYSFSAFSSTYATSNILAAPPPPLVHIPSHILVLYSTSPPECGASSFTRWDSLTTSKKEEASLYNQRSLRYVKLFRHGLRLLQGRHH